MEEEKKQIPPDNNLVWAILSTLICCWPFGVIAIVYAAKVDKLWDRGFHVEAVQASEKSKKWAIISAIMAGVFWLLYVAVIVIGALVCANC